MQHIQYICIKRDFQALITVQRLTETTLSEKQIGGTTVHCQEYLDEHGMRFYKISSPDRNIPRNSWFSKEFDIKIINCHLKFSGDPHWFSEDIHWGYFYGFHKDDLQVPKPLSYSVSEYNGNYQISGPWQDRKDRFAYIYMDRNGSMITYNQFCNEETFITAAASSTPLLNTLNPKAAGKIKNLRKRLKPIEKVAATRRDDLDDTLLDF